MSFFDSPKNRAIWEKHMSVLREEKAERKKTGYAPVERESQMEAAEGSPFRRKITLKQLEQKEFGEEGVRRVKRPGKELRAAKQMERQAAKQDAKGKGFGL